MKDKLGHGQDAKPIFLQVMENGCVDEGEEMKGQAAMEFLMTYGWAILVVMAAVGALIYFGVLPNHKTTNYCESRNMTTDIFNQTNCKRTECKTYENNYTDCRYVNVPIPVVSNG